MEQQLKEILFNNNLKKEKLLTEQTIKSYFSRIKSLINEFKLYNGETINILFFINNYNQIINYLDDNIKNTSSKITIISAIIYLILFFVDNKDKKITKLYNNSLNIYKEKIKDLKDNIDINNTNDKSQKELDNWLDYNEIVRIFNYNYDKYINIIEDKKIVKIDEYFNIQNMILLSFYVLIEPVRSSEIATLKYKDYSVNNDNYIDFKNKKLVFNNYKTSYTKNKTTVDLKDNKLLLDLIQSFIEFKKKNKFNREFLFNSNDDTNIDNSAITKRLNKIIGKRISSSMLRKIYLSNKYGDSLKTIKDIQNSANNMMNSINVITKNYIKR